MGDLSENAEYDAAKDEQRDIETQIAELEEILKNAEVIQDDKHKAIFAEMLTARSTTCNVVAATTAPL